MKASLRRLARGTLRMAMLLGSSDREIRSRGQHRLGSDGYLRGRVFPLISLRAQMMSES